MFAVDRRVMARLEPTVRRVLIVDPNAHAARLIQDIMKSVGSREVVIEADQKRGLRMAGAMDPGLVFTERSGPGLDGEELARELRRSTLPCRRVPIIMVTAEATATTIKGARDSGVHEFLRKPFASGDILKRVENVAVNPRDWIEGMSYIGPDRRRFNSGEFSGAAKRKSDEAATGASAALVAKDLAMRILATALDQFDHDPMQAVRAIREQALQLKALGILAADAWLITAVGALEAALAAGPPTKAAITTPINDLLAMHQAAGHMLKRTG